VVAIPPVDGLQTPRQGHYGVHQELHLPKLSSKHNFTEKFVVTYFSAMQFLPSIIKIAPVV
jgi:hypothetical protein